MSSRLHDLLSGLSDSLKFSNKFGLIWQRVFQRDNPIVHYVWKGRWHVYGRHQSGDHGSIKEVLAQGAYDPCLNEVCENRSFTYVNVGANVGSFDIAVAARGIDVPYACTIELNPWTFSRLAFNISANGLFHVRTVNVGIAGEPGSIPFSPREDSVTDCIYNEVSNPAAVVQRVMLDTLEGALEKVDLAGRTFDLLKLDAEGAEYGIIKSIEPGTIRRFAHIVMEFHQPPAGESPDEIYSKLATCGFESREPRWAAGSPPQLRMFRRG